MKRVTLAAGEKPVLIDRDLPKDGVVRIDGRLHVGSMGALQRLVDDLNRDWVVLQTVPPCLMQRRTGELVALEGVPDPESPPVCERCGERHG